MLLQDNADQQCVQPGLGSLHIDVRWGRFLFEGWRAHAAILAIADVIV